MTVEPPSPTPAKDGAVGGFVGWLVGERVARGLVTFLVLGAVARHLGPDGFGALNTAIAVATLLIPLAMLGIDSLVVRDLVATPGNSGSLLCTALVLRAGAGVVSLGLLGALSFSGNSPASPALLWPASIALLSQAGEVFDLWYRSRTQSRTTVLVRFGVVAAGAVAKVALVAAGAGVAAFAWVYGLECAAFPALLAFTWMRSGASTGAWGWRGHVAARWLREGWGFLACGLLVSAALRSDQLVVSRLLGDAPAGRYFAALRLVEIAVFLATALGNALLPGLVREIRSAPPGTPRIQPYFDACAALGWLCFAGAVALGPLVVRLLFGPGFEGSALVLVLYSAGNIPLFIGTIRGHLLVIRSASGTQAAFALAMFIGQALGSVWLVPRLGLAGGALAFAATQMLTVFAGPLLLPQARACLVPQLKALAVPFRPSAWRPLLRLALG